MVVEWDMSERRGHQALEGGIEQIFLGEELARRREYSESRLRLLTRKSKPFSTTHFNDQKAHLIQRH